MSLSQATEQRLVDATHLLLEKVDAGEEPTEAMFKVADEMQLTVPFVDRVSHAFNIGRVRAQQKQGSHTLDCMGEVPLVDPDEVIRRLYPSVTPPNRVKQASIIDNVWLQPAESPAVLVKAAANEDTELPPPTPNRWHEAEQLKQANLQVSLAKHAKEEAELQHTLAIEEFNTRVAQLDSYFAKSAIDRLPYAEVHHNIKLDGDPTALRILNFVASQRPNVKQAADQQVLFGPIEVNQSPYKEIVAAAVSAKVADFRKQALADCDKALAQAEKACQQVRLRQLPEKQAIDPIDMAGGALGGQAMKWLNDSSGVWNLPSDEIKSTVNELGSGDHEAKLRGIHTQAMLHDFMNNDQILGSYDQGEVLRAYNEVAKSMPSASDNPAAMRSMIRRMLAQGGQEPFEIKEMTDIEKNIAASRRPLTLD